MKKEKDKTSQGIENQPLFKKYSSKKVSDLNYVRYTLIKVIFK